MKNYFIALEMDLIGVISIACISIVTVLYAFFKHSFQYWKFRGVPFDKPSIPFGNVENLGSTVHLSHFVKSLYDKYKSSGAKICGFYYCTRPVAILLDLQLIKAIMVKDSVLFNDRGLCLYQI